MSRWLPLRCTSECTVPLPTRPTIATRHRCKRTLSSGTLLSTRWWSVAHCHHKHWTSLEPSQVCKWFQSDRCRWLSVGTRWSCRTRPADWFHCQWLISECSIKQRQSHWLWLSCWVSECSLSQSGDRMWWRMADFFWVWVWWLHCCSCSSWWTPNRTRLASHTDTSMKILMMILMILLSHTRSPARQCTCHCIRHRWPGCRHHNSSKTVDHRHKSRCTSWQSRTRTLTYKCTRYWTKLNFNWLNTSGKWWCRNWQKLTCILSCYLNRNRNKCLRRVVLCRNNWVCQRPVWNWGHIEGIKNRRIHHSLACTLHRFVESHHTCKELHSGSLKRLECVQTSKILLLL